MSIIKNTTSWFENLSTKWQWGVIGAAILLIQSIFVAWDDRRPVGAFFENIVAIILHLGLGVGGFFGAIYVGIKVSEIKKTKALGWIAGLLVLAVAMFTLFLTTKIPGVGWRINKMIESDDLGDY